MPVDSITNWSKRPSCASRLTSCSRSSRSVQQIQPLLISTSFSSVRDSPAPPWRTSSASIFTRSEEHTSELQSLMRISYAVFCLKKKNKHQLQSYTQQTAD